MLSAAIIVVLLPAGANQPAKPKPGEVWDAAMSDYELWHNVPFLQGHGPGYDALETPWRILEKGDRRTWATAPSARLPVYVADGGTAKEMVLDHVWGSRYRVRGEGEGRCSMADGPRCLALRDEYVALRKPGARRTAGTGGGSLPAGTGHGSSAVSQLFREYRRVGSHLTGAAKQQFPPELRYIGLGSSVGVGTRRLRPWESGRDLHPTANPAWEAVGYPGFARRLGAAPPPGAAATRALGAPRPASRQQPSPVATSKKAPQAKPVLAPRVRAQMVLRKGGELTEELVANMRIQDMKEALTALGMDMVSPTRATDRLFTARLCELTRCCRSRRAARSRITGSSSSFSPPRWGRRTAGRSPSRCRGQGRSAGRRLRPLPLGRHRPTSGCGRSAGDSRCTRRRTTGTRCRSIAASGATLRVSSGASRRSRPTAAGSGTRGAARLSSRARTACTGSRGSAARTGPRAASCLCSATQRTRWRRSAG